MSRCLAAAFLLLILAVPATCTAGDRIWSALVLATKEDPPAPVPQILKEFASAIQKVFGYNSLYLLGEKKRELYDGGEEWLVPTTEFFLKVQCLARGVTAYTLRIELYRGKNLLVTTEAKLARDAPLYIRGPEWGRGQLIFVLEVR
jgi:hypothetical protein